MHGRLLLVTLLALLALAAPAGAATTIGPDLTAASPDDGGYSGAATAVGARAPAAGVLTGWRLRAQSSVSARLRVVEPVGASAFRAVRSGGAQSASGSASQLLPVRLPIAEGQRIAVAAGGDLRAFAGATAPILLAGTLADGETATATAAPALLAQAVLEPDADGDGFGDESQDDCPTDPERQAPPCVPVADLAVTGTAPAQVGALDPLGQTFTITNRGPATAAAVRLTLAESGAGLDGPATVTALAPGASLTVHPTYVEPAIFPPFPGVRAATLTAASDLRDPDTTNNTLRLATERLPFVGSIGTPPPTPPVLRPCFNKIAGTRDDELLRGTQFADRLLGGAGADRILGGAGDDCLEGGSGADVLDGQAGADRLSGGLGGDHLIGGTGADTLTGGLGDDRLSAGPGNDLLQPGRGRDRIDAGGGDDTITARDRVRETIVCGPGRDSARVDRVDVVRGCEKVARG